MKMSIFAVLLCVVAGHSRAVEGLYGVSTIGAANTEFSSADLTSMSYKLGIGYQIERQWYFEAGFQKLANDSLATELPSSMAQLQDGSMPLDATALYAAFLGKAAGPAGELFYRVGLLKTDTKGQQVLQGEQSCALGKGTSIALSAEETYTFCEFDEGGIAGVIGIGFDFFIGPRTMLRTEIEYIKGENNFTASAAYLGLRYNF